MKRNSVVKVLILISVLNFIVMATKIILGYKTNSSAVVADGIHSLSDLLANFVGMVAIIVASKPADNNHGYGHGKIETIASVLVSIVIFYTGIKILISGVVKFTNPSDPDFSVVSISIIFITLLINIFVTRYELSRGKKLKSSFLIADAKHTLSDVYVTIGVLVSTFIILLGGPIIVDAIISVVIGLLIIKTAIEIFTKAASILTDSSIIANEELEMFIESFEGVEEVHYLKNRGNEINVYLEFHIMFDPNMTVYNAHAIVEDIEVAIKEKYDYNFIFTTHIEPFVDEFKIKKGNVK